MSKNDPIKGYEIDLFVLIKWLWQGKLIIISSMVIAGLIGFFLNLSKKPDYEATLTYSLVNVPIFYGKEKLKVVNDFAALFHSKNIFENWKRDKKNISMSFDDISLTQIVDGVIMLKDSGDKIAILLNKKKGNNLMLVKTNNLQMLDNFYNYAIYVNNELNLLYLERTQDEINAIEKRFKGITTKNSNIVEKLLKLDSYLVAVQKGETSFSIHRPTNPKKISSGLSFIIPLSLFLGLMFGAFFVISRKVIYKLQKQ
jgi:hypothetical protein